jgi:hypothetical protein
LRTLFCGQPSHKPKLDLLWSSELDRVSGQLHNELFSPLSMSTKLAGHGLKEKKFIDTE